MHVSGVDGTRLNNVSFLATTCKPLIEGLRLSIGHSRVWCADNQKEIQPQKLEGGHLKSSTTKETDVHHGVFNKTCPRHAP